jgi:uncharacterized protein
MSYRHGTYGTEIPTSILPPIRTSAGLIVAIGTAPINQLKNYAEAVNKPILAYSYAEAVNALGYNSDFNKYTLCEVMKVCFGLYGVAPVVLINVLSSDHLIDYQGSVTLINDKATLSRSGVLPGTIRIWNESKKYYTLDVDFSHSFSDTGESVISCISSGKINNNEMMAIRYNYLDQSRVKSKDIIGGINVSSHKAEGLELLNEVYPRFGLIPGQIIAPGFSSNSEVGQLMALKAGIVSDIFNAEALTDVSASSRAGALNYKKAVEKKKDHNWVAKTQTVCWPMVRSGNEIHHLSTHLAAATCLLDSHNADIPYRSPSNKTLQMSSAVLRDGTEVWNGLGAANYLNSQGIVTSYHKNGWKTWGNRTAAYPSSTDPKDSFRSCRRMFNWVLNTLIETYWSKIDDPTNKRLIQSVVTSANIWLNGLTANENIAGGRVVFIEKENAVTDLMDGILRFHVFLRSCIQCGE